MHVNIWPVAATTKESWSGNCLDHGGTEESLPSSRVFGYHLWYLHGEITQNLRFNFLARLPPFPLFPVWVPLVRPGLHTSGSDESNWKHVLHASSPDRWDNIILLMTDRERRSEAGRDVGRKILLPQKGSLVLNSSTLSCRRC